MSQGGFLSLRAALLSPERVRGLVLIDTQAGLEDAEAVPAYTAMTDEWIANGPGAVQEIVASIILGENVDPSPWYEKWAAIPKEYLLEPFRCLVGRDDLTVGSGRSAHPPSSSTVAPTPPSRWRAPKRCATGSPPPATSSWSRARATRRT